MRSTTAAFSVVFLLAVVAALAVGQQQPRERELAGKYAVAGTEKSAVLLDKQSGQTWILQHSADPLQASVWLPAAKIDSQDDAAEWRKADQARALIASKRFKLQRELYALHEQREDWKVAAPQSAQLKAIEKKITDYETRLGQLP